MDRYTTTFACNLQDTVDFERLSFVNVCHSFYGDENASEDSETGLFQAIARMLQGGRLPNLKYSTLRFETDPQISPEHIAVVIGEHDTLEYFEVAGCEMCSRNQAPIFLALTENKTLRTLILRDICNCDYEYEKYAATSQLIQSLPLMSIKELSIPVVLTDENGTALKDGLVTAFQGNQYQINFKDSVNQVDIFGPHTFGRTLLLRNNRQLADLEGLKKSCNKKVEPVFRLAIERWAGMDPFIGLGAKARQTMKGRVDGVE